MAEKKPLPVFDFKKITKEQIHDFVKANATPDEKKELRAVAFKKKAPTVMEPEMITNAEGKLVQRQVRRKQKDGSYKMVPKMKAVAVKGGEAVEKYSHRDAVSWFIKTYVDSTPAKAEMINRPQKGSKKAQGQPAKDLFADLWD